MSFAEEYRDTSPEALEVWIQALRRMTDGQRACIALSLSGQAIRLSESGIRAMYPHASEREVFLRAAALRLPRDLMIRAYGWDPEGNADPV
jgi:hypothetical protein